MPKVLIVDDEIAIQRLLVKVMKSNGLEAETVSSGEEALVRLASQAYDLVLLDVMMKGMDGFQVVEQLRSRGNRTPVMILSAKNEDYDTLYGLEIGADDYITKPFNPIVLGGKVKALIRRNNQALEAGDSRLAAGPFVLDLSTMHCYKNMQEVILSTKEIMLMALFMKNVGQVFSKEQIYSQIWGDVIPDPNTVMVYINHLRNKLEDDPKNPQYILTVRGLGYKFLV